VVIGFWCQEYFKKITARLSLRDQLANIDNWETVIAKRFMQKPSCVITLH